MNTIQASELMPIVAQIIGQPTIDALTWQLYPIGGGAGKVVGVLGTLRVAGAAQASGQTVAWSVVVKIIRKPDVAADPWGTSHTPSAWNYWQREILAYQSGTLTDLGEHLVAPRCYAITEQPDGEWRIWLEDIQESPKRWTLDRYGSAARHLGQFNGAYLSGRPLPAEQPWTYPGRIRERVEIASQLVAPFRQYADSAHGRRWLSEQSVARMERLLANAKPLQALMGRLPRCLCHHDAFRRNLLARDKSATEVQTVAIDWSYLGYGGVGEEVGITTAITLSWMEVAGDQARELDRVIFAAYLAGLRDMGWHGDPRLARFGYTTTAALVTGVGWASMAGALIWPNEKAGRDFETVIGHSQDEILDQWALVHPFLLDLGDEALQLMGEIG
jgi:hypothetical protein